MARTLNVVALSAAIEALDRADLAAVGATLDPDVVWEGVSELVPGGGRYRGADSVITGVFEVIADAYEEFRAVPKEFIEADDHVVALGTFRVRPEGTSRTVATPFVVVADFVGGKVSRARWFTDTAEWLFAMPETPPSEADPTHAGDAKCAEGTRTGTAPRS